MASTTPTTAPASATITPSRTDRADGTPSSGAKCESDTYFLRAPRHGESKNAVQPNRRQQNGQRRGVADEKGAHSNGTCEGGNSNRKRDRFSDRHVWIGAVHCATQFGEERRRIASRPNRNPRIDLAGVLPERRIDPYLGGFAPALHRHVGDHTDDLTRSAADQNRRADCMAVGPESPRQRVVDDGHCRRLHGVSVIELPPAEEWRSEGREICGTNLVVLDCHLLTFGPSRQPRSCRPAAENRSDTHH